MQLTHASTFITPVLLRALLTNAVHCIIVATASGFDRRAVHCSSATVASPLHPSCTQSSCMCQLHLLACEHGGRVSQCSACYCQLFFHNHQPCCHHACTSTTSESIVGSDAFYEGLAHCMLCARHGDSHKLPAAAVRASQEVLTSACPNTPTPAHALQAACTAPCRADIPLFPQ
jgi:hypothetical protein